MNQTIDFVEREEKEGGPPQSKKIDMRQIYKLVFEHDGEIMIEGCNTLLFVNFKEGDFVSVTLFLPNLNKTLFGNDDIVEGNVARVRVLESEKTI